MTVAQLGQLHPFSALRQLFKRSAKPVGKSGKKMSHKDLFTDSLLASGVRSYMVMPGQPVWMDRNYSQFALEAYVRNVIAHRAISMVAGAGASVKFKLYDNAPKRVRRELKNHPILDLIKQENPTQAKGEFFRALYQYQLISGNAFVQAVGPKDSVPNELYLLRPDRMAVIAGKGTMPAGYRYTVNGQATDFPVDRISGQSRILHLKNFHPLNDWYGLSPIEAAAYSIDQHNQSGAWNQALLQNGARPSGALVVRTESSGGGTLSDDQYNRVKLQIDEQFTGAANAGRPLLLEGGLDWKEMSLTPKDMDFVEAKNSSARDIALAFGVPPQLLGIPGDNTYSNLQEARLALWEQTVVPMVCATTDALNNWLVPMFDGNLELVPDTDGISALAIRNQAIWDRVQKATFLTEDEKRAAVGYAPLSPQVKTSRPRSGRKKTHGRRLRKDFDLADDIGDGGGDSWDDGDYNYDDLNDDYPDLYPDHVDGNGGNASAYQGEPDEPIDPVYPIEDILMGLTGGEALAALKGLGEGAALGEEAAGAVGDAVGDNVSTAMQSVEDYLGGEPDVFYNNDGDMIAMGDGKKIRFDINDPHADDPHFHIEREPDDGNGRWPSVDQHRYYFNGDDVEEGD